MKMTTEQLYAYFQQCHICESLRREDVETMKGYLDERVFRPNEIIADKGEVGEALYFLISGSPILTEGSGENEVVVANLAPGKLVGEMSFFDKKPRRVRMKAGDEEVHALVLSRPMYERLRIEHPLIALNVLENAIVSLDFLIRDMGDNMVDLSRYVHGPGKR